MDHGTLPPAWSHIPDVGPSYVVVSAIVVAVMFGTWLTRVTALAVFAVLVFVSRIFAGLTSLHVAAVGHLTAMITAVALGLLLAVRHRGVRAAAPDGTTRTPDAATRPAPAFPRARRMRSASRFGHRFDEPTRGTGTAFSAC